jgi:hypothetical protein
MIDNLSNLFKVTDLPDNTWSVSWPGRGSVKQNAHKEIIANFAFQTGSWQVGLASSNDKIITIDAMLYETNTFGLAIMLEQIPDIIAVKLDTMEHVNKFTDAMEKHILWKLLSKQHDTIRVL